MLVSPPRVALSAMLVAAGLGFVIGGLLLAGANPQFRDGLGVLGVLTFFGAFVLVGLVHGILAALGAGAALLLRLPVRGVALGAAAAPLLAWLVLGLVVGAGWFLFTAGIGVLVAVLSGVGALVLLEVDARRAPAASEVRMPS